MLKQSITWQKEDETVNIYILQGAYRRLVSICFFKAFTLSSLNFRILLFLSTIPLESSFFCLSLTSIQKIFWFDQAKFLVHFRYNIDQMVLSLINISNWVIYDELYHKWIEKYVLFCCNEFWMKTFRKKGHNFTVIWSTKNWFWILRIYSWQQLNYKYFKKKHIHKTKNKNN